MTYLLKSVPQLGKIVNNKIYKDYNNFINLRSRKVKDDINKAPTNLKHQSIFIKKVDIIVYSYEE